ncbi:MAG: hypothetical protein RI894_2059, partial [Bacteroidota bacterium]
MPFTLKYIQKAVFAAVFACLAMPYLIAQSGTLKGKITASDSNEALNYATVTMLAADGKIVQAAATDSAGAYKIKNIAVGCYTVKISYIGFKEYSLANVCIEAGKNTKLSVALKPNEDNQIGQVTITESKSVFQNDIDKKVYNVAQDITSDGATTLEALANVPSVSVDIDGNIAMRGSGSVRIWIDGRPVKSGGKIDILSQIPANAI